MSIITYCVSAAFARRRWHKLHPSGWSCFSLESRFWSSIKVRGDKGQCNGQLPKTNPGNPAKTFLLNITFFFLFWFAYVETRKWIWSIWECWGCWREQDLAWHEHECWKWSMPKHKMTKSEHSTITKQFFSCCKSSVQCSTQNFSDIHQQRVFFFASSSLYSPSAFSTGLRRGYHWDSHTIAHLHFCFHSYKSKPSYVTDNYQIHEIAERSFFIANSSNEPLPWLPADFISSWRWLCTST